MPKGKTFSGRCMKCKEQKEFVGKVSQTARGGNIAKGQCPDCGTTVCRMLGKSKG